MTDKRDSAFGFPTKAEQRFNAGLGQRYMRDGITIRCHDVSRHRLALEREKRNDPELTGDEAWPEAQCGNSAIPGAFVCKSHKDRSVTLRNTLTVADYASGDLRTKIDQLARNPDYISRQGEIIQLMAFNAQLFEEMGEQGDGIEAWSVVAEGLDHILAGEITLGVKMIEDMMKTRLRYYASMQQYRENTKLLKDLTKVQVQTAAKLKTMATAEQVQHMLDSVYRGISDIISRHLQNNDKLREIIIYDFTRLFRQLAGAGVVERGEPSGEEPTGSAGGDQETAAEQVVE